MRRGGKSLGLYTLGIAALFLAGFLLLVIFGAGTYRDAAAVQEENNESRALLSYIATSVKSGDRAGGVSLREGAEGPVLVLGDGSGYALHIFKYRGNLMEDYCAAEEEPDPEESSVLGATEVFSVQRLEGDTILVETDAGRVLLHLRSGGGAE